MPKIVKLRQSLEEVKLDFVIETIFSLGPDDKVIVFAEYMSTVEALKSALAAAGIHHVSLVGSDSVRNRQRAVDEFEGNRECRAFITTRAAGGVGITLVSANYVLFASMPWNPALLRQAEDRAYRLGQTRDVYVIIPIIPHTIDEQVWELLGSKQVLEEDVIEASIHEEEVVESVAAVLQAA
jgi:SNF2 family DNA or RNA helicase